MEYRTDRNEKIEYPKDRNPEILARRLAMYNDHKGPRVGDFLKLGDKYTRFTHDWGIESNCMQTGGFENSSGYYFGEGYCSYSGGLNPGVQLSDLIPTEETRKGTIWFFRNDHATSHNSVYFEIEHRVFVLKPGADSKGVWLD